MTHDGIAVPTTADIDDQEQLVGILETVIETAKNLVSHERQQQDDHDLTEQADLSPLFNLEDDAGFTLEALENALSSINIENHWQHDDWEPGKPCPSCGGRKISVIDPREAIVTYDNADNVTTYEPGSVGGPELNHCCRECGTLLSQHPAITLFWIG